MKKTIEIRIDWCKLKKLIHKTLKYYLIVIISINIIIWLLIIISPMFHDFYEQGFFIKAKPYAFIHSHGGYVRDCYDYNATLWYEGYNFSSNTSEIHGWSESLRLCEEYHEMSLYGYDYITRDFVEGLYGDGYTHIYGTWCEAGDSNFIYRDFNGSVTRWPDYVKRNYVPGGTLPVFWGFGFVLVNIK